MELKIFKHAESGRSMVEMLGILAIIGILTIGGVYGYIYGMNRYRANEIIDGATKRAYAIATMLNSGKTVSDVSLSEFSSFDEVPGGTFSQEVQDFESQFGLTVRGVEKPVCENLIRMMGKTTTLRAITRESNYEVDLKPGDCDEGENNLYLMYNLDMMGIVSDQVAGNASSSIGGNSNISSSGDNEENNNIVDENRNECLERGYYFVSGFEPDEGRCFRTREVMETYANASEGTCSCIGDSDFPDWIDDDFKNMTNELEAGEEYTSRDCWCYQP